MHTEELWNHFQAKAHWFSFSLHQKRWSLLFLYSVFDPSCPSLPAIHSSGPDKDGPSNKRSRCLSGPSVRLLREEDNRRGAGELGSSEEERKGHERRRKKRGAERRGEEHVVSPTPEVSGRPLLSVPYLQKASFRVSPNEHSCPHSVPQWSPPQPLSLLTMENIAPIKPRRQWAGVGEGGGGVCVICVRMRGQAGGSAG